MRRFFIEQFDVNGPTAIIKGSDSNHIKNVLRLRPGDKIGLFDGTGYEYESCITAFSPGKVELRVLKKFPSTTESPLHLTVAQAFLKDKKMDGLVRQVTELGITEWLPF
ncbi:MAG: RsmE family RNA methyltransferase, partial [Deltaproteobacteria bacterium]|nr:RsmE family RNA methyltransferase [Deltaproteobacteria bacterium]